MTKKEETRATITELVARSDNDHGGFAARPGRSGSKSGSYEGQSRRSNTAEIKSRLIEQNMLVDGSVLGPEYYDEYRRIKRPLLSNAFGKNSSMVENGNLIMVTSSVPGEGKTHTAMNLALSIALERDHTVLLVDSDVTRYGISRMLGVGDRPGLVEVLEEEAGISDIILRTDIDNLSVIPAGRQSGYVTELIASQRMNQVVRELGTRYDDRFIIFDSPPLLPTPQTQVLAGLVGQVVFVIEAGKTPQSVVNDALKMIPEDQATGLVMNKSEGMTSRSSYYYGYYSSETM